MKLLGIDLETTDLDLKTGRVVEVGAVLYDWGTHTPLEIYSKLVNEKGRPASEERYNGSLITEEMIVTYGVEPQTIVQDLFHLSEQADYIVAHNGEYFDKPMLEAFYQRNKFCNTLTLPWLDTLYHIEYSELVGSKGLRNIAAFHEFVNPFLHRAVFDVMTMFKVLKN